MPKKPLKQAKQSTTEPQELELLSGQRQKSESDKAVQACNDWLRMGAGRSLPDLQQLYTDTNRSIPITASLATLKMWSSTFGWAERAREFDAGWEARKNAEREAVLNYGLAHEYERLRKLYRLAALLEAQIYERGKPTSDGSPGVLHNLWLPDVRQVGTGENAERVDIERFNAPLLEQYRKVLDDIAKEVGGRVIKEDVTMQASVTWADIVKKARDELSE